MKSNHVALICLTVFLIITGANAFAQTTDTYFRIDGDQQGQMIWVGGQNGDWVHDFIFYPGLNWLEADFGYSFPVAEGNYVQPMFGLIHDPIAGRLSYYVPQIFWFSDVGRHSSELWGVFCLHATENLTDYHWILLQERYEVNSLIRVGPQFESFYDYTLKQSTGTYLGFGMKIAYGEKATVDLSISKDLDADRGVARMTFLRYF